MAQHEEEQAPGRAIRMYMKSIAQAARAASPIRRRKDEEKKKECPVQQGKTREPQCPTEAKEQQSPKENQKPMTEKEQFQKPIDFRISASNSLLASSSDREIEITGSVASKKIMERGATQNNILDSIGLNRPGQSTPSNHIRVQCHSSPAQSENSLSFRRVQSEKNVRETPTSVSTTSGPSPKGRSPRLPWKGSFGNKRLFKRLSKSPLRKKQVATALQEAEQNRSLLPTPASLTGGGNLPAEPPFHQHSLAPQETDNEISVLTSSSEGRTPSSYTASSDEISSGASSDSSGSSVSHVGESFSSQSTYTVSSDDLDNDSSKGMSSTVNKSSRSLSKISGVLVEKPPHDGSLFCLPLEGAMIMLQQAKSKDTVTVSTTSDSSALREPSSIELTSTGSTTGNSSMPPPIPAGGKKCRLFIRQVQSENSANRCQIEILPLEGEHGELPNGTSSLVLSSGMGVWSDVQEIPSSFTEGQYSYCRRNETEISDAFTDIRDNLSVFHEKDLMIFLASSANSDTTPAIQFAVSVDRLEFEKNLKLRRLQPGAKYLKEKSTQDTEDCSDAFTDDCGEFTAENSDAFTDLSGSMKLSSMSEKSSTPGQTIILDSVTSNNDPALEVKLIESIVEPATTQSEDILHYQPTKDEISEAFTKQSGSAWNFEMGMGMWSLDSLRVLSTASSHHHDPKYVNTTASIANPSNLSGALSGTFSGEEADGEHDISRKSVVARPFEPHAGVEVGLFGILEEEIY